MSGRPSWSDATEGQSAFEMACSCRSGGFVLVRPDRAGTWKCNLCKQGWATGRKVKLGPGGALPPPDELAMAS